LAYFLEVRSQTSAPIVYVLGNREYYGKMFHSCPGYYSDCLSKVSDLHVLDKASVNIGGTFFLGTTLWTNFDDSRNLCRASDVSNDFSRMRKLNKYYNISYMSMHDILAEHRNCREALTYEFRSFRDADSVVLTHHCPSYFCVPERDSDNPFLSLYYVELSDFMIHYRPKAWLFGHTHRSCRKMVGTTLVASNPWGYSREGCSEYEEEYLIEV